MLLLLLYEYQQRKRGAASISHIMEDLRTLYVSSEIFRDLGDPCVCCGSWRRFILEYPLQFKLAVEKAVKVTNFQPMQQELAIAEQVPCQYCSKLFAAPSLNGHWFKVHNHRNALRLKVSSEHCIMCLKMFWNRARLMHRFSHRSGVCRRDYLHCVKNQHLTLITPPEGAERERLRTAS